jgi:Mrp family chromosome partitioning ATPase/ElaB/YqjD/DUF883 family membrane-anchored ribosome-binding protein
MVAEQTAIKLHLISDNMPASEKEAIIGNVLGKISSDHIGDTNLITISATSSDPAETARLANATAEVYIEKGISDRNRRAREMMEFVKSQMDDAQGKLKGTEDALKHFTEHSGAKGIGGYLSNRLLDLQNKKSDLLKKYTEQHPEVQRIKEQIESIEHQMSQLPAEELEYARLSREVAINEELYTLLAKRFKEAQISAADRVQSAFIITPASEPSSPIRPNKVTNITTGAVIGIFLGLILALVFENLDTSIGTIEDVEKYLNLPVLGIIPHIEPQQVKYSDKHTGKLLQIQSKLIVHHPPKSPFAEAYHTLRTNLRFALQNKDKSHIILFSSAGISEGKTLTASNFAVVAAESGIKTLLIETDLRIPSIHKMFGLPRDPGLSDCLIGTKHWKDVIRGTTDFLMSDIPMEKIIQSPGIENLRVITSGPIPPNPIDLFNGPAMPSIFEELSREYSLIILDCPPILLFADTMIIGTYVTGSIIIYRAGKIARGALKRAKDQLANVKVPILGVVLNDIHASDMEPHYGYNYTNRYYTKNPESPDS